MSTVDREPVVYRRLTSGKLLAVRHEPMENGGWVGTYEDITERERAADELKEQHRRFDIALNNMAHGLCMFDENMRLIVSNKRYAEMFNLDPAQVRPGMPIREIVCDAASRSGNHRHRDITLEELLRQLRRMRCTRAIWSCTATWPTGASSSSRTSRCRRAAGSRSTRTSPSAIAPRRASRTWRGTTR